MIGYIYILTYKFMSNNDTDYSVQDVVDDFNLNPSICIPRVFVNIPVREIINIFQNKLNIGPIKKVDVVNNNINNKSNNNRQKNDTITEPNIQQNHGNHNFKKVFIHFKYWNEDKQHIRTMLNEGKIIKIVYDNPWFWKCSLNRSCYD